MNMVIPFIGKRYKVIEGSFLGFIGECISYDLEHDLPVILQDLKYNTAAVKLHEIQPLEGDDDKDISRLQKN